MYGNTSSLSSHSQLVQNVLSAHRSSHRHRHTGSSDGVSRGSYHKPSGSYHKPSGSYQKPPGSYHKPSGSYQTPSGSYQKPPGSYQTPSGSYQKPPGSYQKPPAGSYNKPPGSYQKPSGSYQKPSGSYQKPSGSYQKPPGSYPKPPGSYPKPPGSHQKPSGSYNKPSDSSHKPSECSGSNWFTGLWSIFDSDSDSESDGPLKLTKIDLLPDENGREHHTDEFEEHNVVRRGQPFYVELNIENYDPHEDMLEVELQFGDNPVPNNGTLQRMPVDMSSNLEEGKWSAAISSMVPGRYKVAINSPPDAIVGKYHVIIVTKSDGKTFRSKKTDDNTVVILFNPWVKEDMTYMDDEAKLAEYVLNEHGYQYVGTRRWPGKRQPWNFGQFEPKILDACLWLLDRSNIRTESRRDAVIVSRIVSKMVNSADDNGVLVGNWTDNFRGGSFPWSWNGSVEILLQYYAQKRPVKFGQCWVFSGITTTVLRCLGIPARSVTNYDSAHDTDVSMTIDSYYNERGYPLNTTRDSVWNFHVWNEAWMARPDLPEGYGGWQALDATPQELSDGKSQCGPCPVSAIKNGLVYLPYDTKFVFAEVNADRVNWQVDRRGNLIKLGVNKHAVGGAISTKAVGSHDREDLTENYKYPEGSDQERVAVRTAVSHGIRPNTYDDVIKKEDVEFELHADDETYIGENIHVRLTMKNLTSEPRRVTAHLTAQAMYYTGVPAYDIGEMEEDVTVPPMSAAWVDMTYTPSEYLDKLVEQAIVKVHALAHVDNTGQVYVGQDDFLLISPELTITAPGVMILGEQTTVEIELTNPLDVTLSKAEFYIEGPGLQKAKKISHRPIKPGETARVAEKMTPRRRGQKTIIASFTSDKIKQVTGEHDVSVTTMSDMQR